MGHNRGVNVLRDPQKVDRLALFTGSFGFNRDGGLRSSS